jgi:predicted nucleic-acid-binding Zn-ribbon protein
MYMKLDKKCPTCGSHLDFVEEKYGVYMQCRRCRMSVYVPAEVAAEYIDDFPTLIEIMTMELLDMEKRRAKKR